MCSLTVFIQLAFNGDLNPWKHPWLSLNLVIFTKQMCLVAAEYLFLFSFPGYFPQTAFLLFWAVAVASAVSVRECCDDKMAVPDEDVVVLIDYLIYFMFWGVCLQFCFRSLFL